jgi:pimeloyl-ACP methyl ester carboxylesterase
MRNLPFSTYCFSLFRTIFPVLVYLFLPFGSAGQEKVSFYSDDSLKITADLYLKDYNFPFILLFHQGGASRGEYSEIALRLLKLDYNCLAIDLRAGEKINYVTNETAERAKSRKIPHSFLDAKKDIEASIRYIRKFNFKPVVLFGSSYSASLCLVVAVNNPQVNAVIAFSPGEYFRPELVVKDAISGLKQPVFISATSLEYEFVEQMLSDIPQANKYIYKPSKGKGEHGAKMLWQSCESADECWLELMLFFKKIR